MRIGVRAPNHLGDALMAMPTIRGLTTLGPVEVRGPAFLPTIYRDLDVTYGKPGRWGGVDAVVLLAPSLRAGLEAIGVPRRVGWPTDLRRPLLTDVVDARGHRREAMAALGRVLGAEPVGAPTFTLRAGETGPDVPEGHLGLNPVVKGDSTRAWGRLSEVAERWAGPVVAYAGPGEGERLTAPARALRCVGTDLVAFAAALQRCTVFLSNDAGAAHFAAACGVPTVVVFTSTSPETTGPLGAVPVFGVGPPCRPCLKRSCSVGLGCHDIEVDAVLAAVQRAVPGRIVHAGGGRMEPTEAGR